MIKKKLPKFGYLSLSENISIVGIDLVELLAQLIAIDQVHLVPVAHVLMQLTQDRLLVRIVDVRGGATAARHGISPWTIDHVERGWILGVVGLTARVARPIAQASRQKFYQLLVVDEASLHVGRNEP